MKSEKPLNLPSASQSKLTGPRTRGANGVSPTIEGSKAGALISKDRSWMSQFKEKTNLLSAVFVLFSPSTDCMIPTCIGESHLLCWISIQMFIFSGDTLTDSTTNHVLPAIWTSLSPVKLRHEVNHHILSTNFPVSLLLAVHGTVYENWLTQHKQLKYAEINWPWGYPSLSQGLLLAQAPSKALHGALSMG